MINNEPSEEVQRQYEEESNKYITKKLEAQGEVFLSCDKDNKYIFDDYKEPDSYIPDGW
jgi:hypothetical protein